MTSPARPGEGDTAAALRQALADAQAGRYQVFVIWSLDRLTRGGIREALNTLHAFEQSGVKVVSGQEQWVEAVGELSDLMLWT